MVHYITSAHIANVAIPMRQVVAIEPIHGKQYYGIEFKLKNNATERWLYTNEWARNEDEEMVRRLLLERHTE